MENQPLTKAETLADLSGKITNGVVPELLFFSASDWENDREAVLERVSSSFSSSELAVRSSARNEDGDEASLAGHYRSFLNVSNERHSLSRTIDVVKVSIGNNSNNQVLVQQMVSHPELSGVILTHELSTGAPYYVIEYQESSQTDLVTGGRCTPVNIAVYRKTPGSYIRPAFVRRILLLTHELEQRFGRPLDIEFAQTQKGTVFLLQVRPISVVRNWNRRADKSISQALKNLESFLVERNRHKPHLAGKSTVLGQMPDWNPAELIGVKPSPLSVSLFSFLITDSVWQEARALMGYRPVPKEPLMVILAGRPFIDVRSSFNSFLPQGLPTPVEEAVVSAWVDRLRENPEFHDKVEFEIAQTVLDFSFDASYRTRYAGLLARRRFERFRERLRCLTQANVSLRRGASLIRALLSISVLEGIESRRNRERSSHPLYRTFQLLDECREYGTLPFSIIARHAFMAESLLRSAVFRGALEEKRVLEFRRSLRTVAAQLTTDFTRVQDGSLTRESFLQRYGHLRPGTFDIASLRYDQRPDLFAIQHRGGKTNETPPPVFVPTTGEERALRRLLQEVGLDVSVDELLRYASKAIAGREHAKFVFSKHLSDALEYLAHWGEGFGLTRHDLAFLRLEDLSDTLISPITRDTESHFYALAETRRDLLREASRIRLGHLIRDVVDLYVIVTDRDQPNFVTSKSVEGIPVQLARRAITGDELSRRIVCLECADPGHDWIFTRNIIGLITKYGGANSHMAIRCAELDIPAAIGVGEALFEHLVNAETIEIRCFEKVVRPIYG